MKYLMMLSRQNLRQVNNINHVSVEPEERMRLKMPGRQVRIFIYEILCGAPIGATFE